METIILENCLNRIKAKIRKNGSLTWEDARKAMFGGSYNRSDAIFHNQTIMKWIEEGKLKSIRLEDGDSLVGM
jgi:hypothetical protein